MGHRQLRTSIMKLVVCFALIALAAASPTGMEDMMKHMMMAQAGGQREAESKGGIDDLWGVLAAAHDNERGMGARAQAATADRDITDMLELFGAGMMDADAEEMKKWAEKTFMALLEHRMEYGDMEGVMKMMAWAAKMDADRVRAAGHKLMSDEEAEAHFEMLFMKALEAKTAEGDWEAVAAMMQTGEEWEKGAAAAEMAIASAEMQMHLIYMEVMKHKAHIGDWKGVVNMMEGAVLMTAYRLQDPRERLTEEEVKGHKAYKMLLKNKAEEGDWKSVVKMMNWGVQEMAKKQKKEMAEAVFYFGHLLIGGSPDMSEWASAEESESPMPDELRHMMQLMEMMGGKH